MKDHKELTIFGIIVAAFLALFWLPVGSPRFDGAILEALYLTRWYAREHVLLCLIPAFFIAGAISTFVRQGAVMKYLGPDTPKPLAYGVASVSGSILAVCSCTVLPLFMGIYRLGAGLGPATAFLYSGPAINVLAIIMTSRILGLEIGIARAVGAVSFAVIIGLMMHFLFRKEQLERKGKMILPDDVAVRPLWQDASFIGAQIGVLVFANWAPAQTDSGIWVAVAGAKWILSGLFLAATLWMTWRWFSKDERKEWLESSWGFAKQILPLLLGGVMVAGFLLGRVGHEGIVPSQWIADSVGGNSLLSTFVASFVGAFMYFATLTEVPILQGLMGNGMGAGPALALLLAGPALSLPSMLVIHGVMGTRKTVAFVTLVIIMATIVGYAYGMFAGA
ncbi:MAG TPA: permease [Fibrobacteria bacterium]|nr:permease [Fibrobacteria bacterium]